MMNYPQALNDPVLDGNERLSALQTWEKENKNRFFVKKSNEVNNHIHTIYSFSPFSPVMAALRARDSGLVAAGCVDHDSIAAAQEMLAAASIVGIGGCVGFELRASFQTGADGTPSPFARRKINNPDSEGSAYMTVQGIPKPAITATADFLTPISEQRLERTRAMTILANDMLRDAQIPEIDFEQDVYNLSQYADGGGITERHLLAAMARNIILQYGKGRKLSEALKVKMGITISPDIASFLADEHNPHYLYDLLGVLKSQCLSSIFIQPDTNECISADRVTAFAESVNAIPAYAYLGDVGVSVTGDKKAEKFEDDCIEELFEELSRLGFRAVTYMPPRNTIEQLHKVRHLCAKWGFMEISGVDINSSRQSFNCPEILTSEFCHLTDTTWALIAHERLASIDRRYGLFSKENPLAAESLAHRLKYYAAFGKKLDVFHPEESAVDMAHTIERGNYA